MKLLTDVRGREAVRPGIARRPSARLYCRSVLYLFPLPAMYTGLEAKATFDQNYLRKPMGFLGNFTFCSFVVTKFCQVFWCLLYMFFLSLLSQIALFGLFYLNNFSVA